VRCRTRRSHTGSNKQAKHPSAYCRVTEGSGPPELPERGVYIRDEEIKEETIKGAFYQPWTLTTIKNTAIDKNTVTGFWPTFCCMLIIHLIFLNPNGNRTFCTSWVGKFFGGLCAYPTSARSRRSKYLILASPSKSTPSPHHAMLILARCYCFSGD
jgi:hypothetical protein